MAVIWENIFYVVDGDGPTLFGHNWLMNIKLNWRNFGVVNIQNKLLCLEGMVNKYSEVFKN